MNLLDTASLVVTPNGYKASKLYSIIPSDGTGDMTFARTGDTATRVNSSGLIETILANKPRLDYLGGTCPKLLLEPQRTNVILQSQDISSASWTKTNSPTIVSNVAVAPDGTNTADSIQDTTGTTFKQISQSFSVSANSTYTYTFYIKKETTRTNFCAFSLYFSGGTVKSAYACFDEVTGIAASITGGNTTPTFKVENFGTFWKVGMTLTDTGSNTNLICEFFPTGSVNGTALSTGTGSARTVWGFQLEAGAYATSYIPTTTASVTANADSCYKSGISSLIGQTEGTIFWDSYYLGGNPNGGQISLINSTTSPNNAIELFIGVNSISIYIEVSGVVKLYTTIASLTLNQRFKLAVAYGENYISAYINGSQVYSYSNTLPIPATSIFSISNYTGGGATFITKNNSLALWKTKLQNTELATLTSL